MFKLKNYKKYLAATVSTAVVASVAAPVVPMANVQAAGFDDVQKGAFYYDAVSELAGNGIINGFGDKTFRPNQDVTRGQVAQILAGFLGLNGENVPDPGFKDVGKKYPFYQAIAALYDAKIINGVSKEVFQPNKPITRAEMSRMLTTAFELVENTDATSVFTDVPAGSWYAGCVGALLDNGITFGKSAASFAPHEKVTRGQIASFIYRAQQNLAETQVIESVTDSVVTIDGKTYEVVDSLKSLFNSANAAALKNANIQFKAADGMITSVSSLEITEEGDTSASGKIVLDGQGATIDGNVTVSGDFVTLKNLTVKGNLKIGAGVQNSFIADTLNVLGKTILAEAQVKSAALPSVGDLANITFIDSILKVVEVNKVVNLVTQGASKLTDLSVSANANISADSTSAISKVTLKAGANEVEINAEVDDLIIDGQGGITLTGQATLGNVKVAQDANVNFDITGVIGNLELVNNAARLLLNIGMEIGNLILPEGTLANTIIKNFEKVKESIGTISEEDTEVPDDQEDPEDPTAPINPTDTVAPAAPGISFVGKSVVNGVVDLLDLKTDLKTKITFSSAGENGAKVGDTLKIKMYSDEKAAINENYKLTEQDINRGYVERVIQTNALRNLLGGLLGDTAGSVVGGFSVASAGQVSGIDSVAGADTVTAASVVVNEDGTASIIDANGEVVASGFIKDLFGGVTGLLGSLIGNNGIISLDGILGQEIGDLVNGTVKTVNGVVEIVDGLVVTVVDGVVTGVVDGLISGAEEVTIEVQLIDKAGNPSPVTKQIYQFKVTDVIAL